MAVRSCSIADYKSLPGNARITAVHIGRVSTQVTSSVEVLRFVCESYIRSGLLSKERVRSFGFGWLGPHPQTMRFPHYLAPGVYMAEDGHGATYLLRTKLLLGRLMIPREYCTIDYICANGASAVTQDSGACAESFLSLWEDGDVEPVNSVQKRIHEFTAQEKEQLVPYKVGIGMRRYAVSSWSDFANTLIAHLYLHFGRVGPKWLLNLQSSPNWKHLDLVKSDSGRIDMNPVSDDLNGTYVCQLATDMLSGIGFDRYAVYLMCVTRSDRPSHDSLKVPAAASSQQENKEIAKIAEPECVQHADTKSVEGDIGDVEAIELTLGRHLRPTFRLLGD